MVAAAGVGTIAVGLCLLNGETVSSVSSESLHIRLTAYGPSKINLLVINLIFQLKIHETVILPVALYWSFICRKEVRISEGEYLDLREGTGGW